MADNQNKRLEERLRLKELDDAADRQYNGGYTGRIHLKMKLPYFVRASGLRGPPYYFEKERRARIEKLQRGLLHRMAMHLDVIYISSERTTLGDVKRDVERVGYWGMQHIGPASIKEFYKLLKIHGIKPFDAEPR